MSIEIKYRDQNLFENQPTPFFSKNTDYLQIGDRWCQVENCSLNGFLIGCNQQELLSAKNQLLGYLSEAFGSMQIGNEFNFGIVEISDIDFSETDLIGSMPYSINFIYYPPESFSGEDSFFGVIEPSDMITYVENPDGTVDMQREISAKGIITNADNKDSAIDNALSFINSRKSKIISPYVIRNYAGNNIMQYYLVSSEESFSRVSNDAKLTQKYKADLTAATSNIIHRYVKNEEESVGQLTIFSYNGQIDAGKNGDFSKVVDTYEKFKQTLGYTFLINEEITEDTNINKITYSISFYKNVNSNTLPKIRDDFSISLKEDSSGSILTASIQGSISPNYGCLEDREGEVEDYLGDVKLSNYHFSIISDLFSDFKADGTKPSSHSLNPVAISETSEKNNGEFTASYSAEFNDRDIPNGFDCMNFSTSISINFSIDQYSIKEYYRGGKYICQDLGFKSREIASVQLNCDGVDSFKGKTECKNAARATMPTLQGRIYEETVDYSKSEEDRTESIKLEISYDAQSSFDL